MTLRNLTDAQLRNLAGDGVFSRGVRYCNEGRVDVHSRSVVEVSLPRSDTRHYPVLAMQVGEIRVLDPSAEADRWFADLKARYRAKRKLLPLLDATS